MRPSFGFGGGSGGGGRGGMGGGNILRAVGRSVTRTGVGIQEPFPNASSPTTGAPTSPRTASGRLSSSSRNHLSLSSAPSSPFSVPLPAGSSPWLPFPSAPYDDYEWVSADGSDDERKSVYLDDFVLGPAPSTDEVHGAVSAIQQVFDSTTYPQFIRDRFGPSSDSDKDITGSGLLQRVSSAGSDLDWCEPPVHLSNLRALQPYGPEAVIDAFNMLHNDPSVQKMVVSLSTDKAVWEAVMNNQAVRELTGSCQTAEGSTLSDGTSEESSDEANPLVDIVRQMFDHTKTRFMDVIDKIGKLMSELFNAPAPHPSAAANEEVNASDPFEGKLRASFMLSMVVFLIVVVSRAQGA